VLENFFVKTDDGWKQNRVEEELKYADSKSKKAKQSAKKRWERNANVMRTHSEGYAIPDNQTTRQPETTLPSAISSDITTVVALTLESQNQHPPIVPPQPGGQTNGPNGSTETIFEWAREYIAVKMGNRKRLFTGRDQTVLAGTRACRVVEFLHTRGFEARLVSDEEMKSFHD
jgi:hypothetical protein